MRCQRRRQSLAAARACRLYVPWKTIEIDGDEASRRAPERPARGRSALHTQAVTVTCAHAQGTLRPGGTPRGAPARGETLLERASGSGYYLIKRASVFKQPIHDPVTVKTGHCHPKRAELCVKRGPGAWAPFQSA